MDIGNSFSTGNAIADLKNASKAAAETKFNELIDEINTKEQDQNSLYGSIQKAGASVTAVGALGKGALKNWQKWKLLKSKIQGTDDGTKAPPNSPRTADDDLIEGEGEEEAPREIEMTDRSVPTEQTGESDLFSSEYTGSFQEPTSVFDTPFQRAEASEEPFQLRGETKTDEPTEVPTEVQTTADTAAPQEYNLVGGGNYPEKPTEGGAGKEDEEEDVEEDDEPFDVIAEMKEGAKGGDYEGYNVGKMEPIEEIDESIQTGERTILPDADVEPFYASKQLQILGKSRGTYGSGGIGNRSEGADVERPMPKESVDASPIEETTEETIEEGVDSTAGNFLQQGLSAFVRGAQNIASDIGRGVSKIGQVIGQFGQKASQAVEQGADALQGATDALQGATGALQGATQGATDALQGATAAGLEVGADAAAETGIGATLEGAGAALDATGVGAPIGAILNVLGGLVLGTSMGAGIIGEVDSNNEQQDATAQAQEQLKQQTSSGIATIAGRYGV